MSRELDELEVRIESETKKTDVDKYASLLCAVRMIKDFADKTMLGSSSWMDYDKQWHIADNGYVCEYLDDLEKWLQKKVCKADE